MNTRSEQWHIWWIPIMFAFIHAPGQVSYPVPVLNNICSCGLNHSGKVTHNGMWLPLCCESDCSVSISQYITNLNACKSHTQIKTLDENCALLGYYTIRCVTTQKNAVLVYFAAEARNDTMNCGYYKVSQSLQYEIPHISFICSNIKS